MRQVFLVAPFTWASCLAAGSRPFPRLRPPPGRPWRSTCLAPSRRAAGRRGPSGPGWTRSSCPVRTSVAKRGGEMRNDVSARWGCLMLGTENWLVLLVTWLENGEKMQDTSGVAPELGEREEAHKKLLRISWTMFYFYLLYTRLPFWKGT